MNTGWFSKAYVCVQASHAAMSNSALRREQLEQARKLNPAADESSRSRDRRHRPLTALMTLRHPAGHDAVAAGHESPGTGRHRHHHTRKRHATSDNATPGKRKKPDVAVAAPRPPRSPKASSAADASSSSAVGVGARVFVRTPVVLKLSAVVVSAAEDGYLEVVYDEYPPDDPCATVRVAVDQIIARTPPPPPSER